MPRLLELVLGIGYDGYLMVEWPKLWDPSLPEPDQFLPAAATFLRDSLDIKREPLAAYKGDKNKPKFAERPQRIPNR